jgi:hypothetical protein
MRVIHGIVLVLLLGAGVTAARAQFDVSWFTIDGGGGMFSTGGGYALGGTIGQPDAGAMSGGGFALTGGFWVGVYACRGDTNCDGVIDFKDINPFVAVLSGGAPCNFYNCDMNGDFVIDFKDINPFVAILSGGGGCP